MSGGRDQARDGAVMSVVLATDRYETAARTLNCLRAQTIHDRLELVLVSLTGEPLGVPAETLSAFARHRVIEQGAPLTLAAGRAVGVLAASAPLVYVAETHGFPHPELAETLVASLRPPWTIAVPGFRNANPDGALSWANLIADYGPWLAAAPGGERKRCPPYNTLFPRALTVAALREDRSALAPGYDLMPALRAGGHRVLAEPAARLDHVNVSLLRAWLPQRFTAGRAQAAVRIRGWSRRRRALYALGSPLIPAVLLSRCVRPFLLARRAHRLPWATFPALVAGTVAVAAGELTAFLFGSTSSAREAHDEFELHKVEYTKAHA